jgi:hypothetical protein
MLILLHSLSLQRVPCTMLGTAAEFASLGTNSGYNTSIAAIVRWSEADI